MANRPLARAIGPRENTLFKAGPRAQWRGSFKRCDMLPRAYPMNP